MEQLLLKGEEKFILSESKTHIVENGVDPKLAHFLKGTRDELNSFQKRLDSGELSGDKLPSTQREIVRLKGILESHEMLGKYDESKLKLTKGIESLKNKQQLLFDIAETIVQTFDIESDCVDFVNNVIESDQAAFRLLPFADMAIAVSNQQLISSKKNEDIENISKWTRETTLVFSQKQELFKNPNLENSESVVKALMKIEAKLVDDSSKFSIENEDDIKKVRLLLKQKISSLIDSIEGNTDSLSNKMKTVEDINEKAIIRSDMAKFKTLVKEYGAVFIRLISQVYTDDLN